MINQVGEYGIYGWYLLGISVTSYGYYKSCHSDGDIIDYFSVLLFFHGTTDFITDAIFTLNLKTESNTDSSIVLLSYCSISILCCSYFMSVITCLWTISYLRNINVHYPQRIIDWLNAHMTIFIVLTVMYNIYATTDLQRSGLFEWSVFKFPITQDEYTQIMKYKFINIVMIENMGQFIVQIMYMNSKTATFNVFKLLTIISTSVSILIAMVKTIATICNKNRNIYMNNKKMKEKSVLDIHYSLESESLNSSHAFAHATLNRAMRKFVNVQLEESIDDFNKNNTQYNVKISRDNIILNFDTYYLEFYDTVRLQHTLAVHLKIVLIHDIEDLRVANGIRQILSKLLKVSAIWEEKHPKADEYTPIKLSKNGRKDMLKMFTKELNCSAKVSLHW